MTSQTPKGIGRRLALLGTATAVMMSLGASTALASIDLSPEPPYSSTEPTEVIVSGEPPAMWEAATHVAIVVCNVEEGVIPGARCDSGSSSGEELVPVGIYGFPGVKVTVQRIWQDFDFTMGIPPKEQETETQCKDEAGTGEQCAVVVSYYEQTEMGPKQLGAETEGIVFS